MATQPEDKPMNTNGKTRGRLISDGKNCVRLKVTSETRIRARELEERFARAMEENAGKKAADENPEEENGKNSSGHLEICRRTDCHLLDCRHPEVQIQSFLGVIEEFSTKDDEDDYEDDYDDCQNPSRMVNPLLRIKFYETEEETAAKTVHPTPTPTPPHSEWKRTEATGEDSLDINGFASIYNGTAVDVMWCDFRDKAAVGVLPRTPGQSCHFLRSLLGSSHFASPWGWLSDDHHDGDEEEKEESSCRTVVVLFDGDPTSNDAIRNFRTGDACPSYFLHAASCVRLPPLKKGQSSAWLDTSLVGNDDMSSECTLLVYKQLPPRDILCRKHPSKKNAALLAGCLWEIYWRQNDDDDDEEEEYDDGKIKMNWFVRSVAPPYVGWRQDYKGLLEPLLAEWETIRDEAVLIPQWTAWPERQHYSSADGSPTSWTVFPLCHCFPANEIENKKWINMTCEYVPNTTALLKNTLGDWLRTALFSRLEPETTLEAHTGWEDLANHVFRLHLPLVVPDDAGLCGTWVDGCVETHQEGRPLCFDDSKTHRAFNYATTERIVLILDLSRPGYLPLGTASGGHTEELDHFIDQLT